MRFEFLNVKCPFIKYSTTRIQNPNEVGLFDILTLLSEFFDPPLSFIEFSVNRFQLLPTSKNSNCIYITLVNNLYEKIFESE